MEAIDDSSSEQESSIINPASLIEDKENIQDEINCDCKNTKVFPYSTEQSS